MKRKGLLSLFLVASVLLTSFAATYAQAETENLMQNPGFESDDLSAWHIVNAQSTYTITTNGAEVHKGERALKAYSLENFVGEYPSSIYQEFTVGGSGKQLASSHTYSASAYVMTKDLLDGWSKFGVEYLNEAGGRIDFYVPDHCWLYGNTGTYVKVQIPTIKFPDGTVKVRIGIFGGKAASQAANVQAVIYADDFSLIDLTPDAEVPPDNLIQNGDFESVNGTLPDNWNAWTQYGEDVASYVDGDTKYEGDYSLRVTGRNTQIDQTFTNINQEGSPIRFGRTYQLSFWVKNDALSTAETIKVGMILTGNYSVWFPAETYFSNTGSSDWRKVSVTFVNDANADPFKSAEFWKFVIICDQTAGAGDKNVWIDNVELMDVTPAAEPDDNLIQNGDFESVDDIRPNNWTTWTQYGEDVASYVDSSTKYEGNYSLRVTGRNTQIDQTFTNINQEGSPIQFGRTYQLSFWVKNDALSTAETIKVGMILTGNYSVWFPTETYFSNTGSSDWRKVSITFTNDANADPFKSAEFWKFVIICDQTAGAGDKSVWVDDFELLDVTPSEEDTPDKLIENGDFESVNDIWPNHWTTWTQYGEDVDSYVDGDTKYEGDYSLRVTGRNTQITQKITNINQDGSPIQFGKTYRLSMWVKNDALSASDTIKVGLIFTGNYSVWFPTETYFCDMAESDWRKVSVTFTNDENMDAFKSAEFWQLTIICDQTAGTGEKSVWIDNIALEELPPSTSLYNENYDLTVTASGLYELTLDCRQLSFGVTYEEIYNLFYTEDNFSVYDIEATREGWNEPIQSGVSIVLRVPEKFAGASELHIGFLGEDGEIELLDFDQSNDMLSFESDSLGCFVLYTQPGKEPKQETNMKVEYSDGTVVDFYGQC